MLRKSVRMVIAMAAVLAVSCVSHVAAEEAEEKIQITYTNYCVGTHTYAPLRGRQIERFNEKYGDQIELVVEELAGDDAYTNKMKTLVATGNLPNVVDAKNGLGDMCIDAGLAWPLNDFLDEDPVYRDEVLPAAMLEMMRKEDGNIYEIYPTPDTIGYFYNKEIFEEVGIKPAETWEEFWDNCEKLLAAGHTPMALMTGENSWTTNLLLAAMITGKGEAGEEFMNKKYPETYQIPEVIEALDEMQVALQKYTTSSALGAGYAATTNVFLSEQAAIIPNGAHQIADFYNTDIVEEGFADKMGWSEYPGGVMLITYSSGYMVCADNEEEARAAWTVIKDFFGDEYQEDAMRSVASVPTSQHVQVPEDMRESNPLFAQVVDATKANTCSGRTFDATAYAPVVDAFGQYYPELAAGTMTGAEMAAKLDEAAATVTE